MLLCRHAVPCNKSMLCFQSMLSCAPGTPQANMLEGGGRTPILSPRELQDLGFSVVVYPLSLLGVCVRAMQVSKLLPLAPSLISPLPSALSPPTPPSSRVVCPLSPLDVCASAPLRRTHWQP